MNPFRGRLIDHVHLRARNLGRSKSFYRATLATLGIPVGGESETHIWWDELWIDELSAYPPSDVATHIHLAFQAQSREAIERWHAAGLAAGGVDNGAPGARGYHPGYYSAFLLDPDGNNVEAVFHG